MELKPIQEYLSSVVFLLVNIRFFREKLIWNHSVVFAFMANGL
jgi:uncharacterized protein (DUF486 family)